MSDSKQNPQDVPAPATEDTTTTASTAVPAADAEETTADGQLDTQRFVKAELGEMTEVESMCPKCEDNGTTRLMMTRIPHFKEVIISSFECPHCGERNNEVQFGGEFGPTHTHYELRVKSVKDMDRQVVKSEYASISIPELELEIPRESQRGSLNTVEGVLDLTIVGLQQDQPLRKHVDPALHDKIEEFCKKITEYKSGNIPFTLHLDDPAGNSYIEGFFDYYHPTIDPQLTFFEKPRTEIDRQLLGLAVDYNTERTKKTEDEVEDGQVGSEVLRMETVCPACHSDGFVNMHETDIPYFKQTIIMAFRCEKCGYRNNEIKSGGSLSEKGVKLTLKVNTVDDLKRDVLKSDTASLQIPEVHLELAPGTLGGFFSSVEGTITQVRDQLQALPQVQFFTGDSAGSAPDGTSGRTMKNFVEALNDLLQVKEPFTFILDDPLGNIYIQNPRAHFPPPEDVDPQLTKEEYTRTAEQDEEYGLNAAHAAEENKETPVEEEKKQDE